MMFIVDEKIQKILNKAAYGIVTLITDEDHEAKEISPRLGSSSAKVPSDFFLDASKYPTTYNRTIDDEKVDIYDVSDGKTIGLSRLNYPSFIRLVKSVCKQKDIGDYISYEMLYKLTWTWILNTYKNKRAEYDYFVYLKIEAEKLLKDYKYYFKILNLEIEHDFVLGEVKIEFLDDTYFDEMKGVVNQEQIDYMIKTFKGHVFASCTIKNIEKQRGNELALEKCYKALDILKLFSPTLRKPEWKTCFEIDTRVKLAKEHQNIIHNIHNIKNFYIGLAASTHPFHFSNEMIRGIVLCSTRFTYLVSLKNPTELQKILVNSLSRYSEAISNFDIHRRIVDIFTLWESLLLENDSVNIQESLIQYGQFILRINDEEFKNFKSFLMGMYSIRSEVVHHANYKILKMEKVAELQKHTTNLIEGLIEFSKVYNSKKIMLNSIFEKLGDNKESIYKKSINTNL